MADEINLGKIVNEEEKYGHVMNNDFDGGLRMDRSYEGTKYTLQDGTVVESKYGSAIIDIYKPDHSHKIIVVSEIKTDSNGTLKVRSW